MDRLLEILSTKLGLGAALAIVGAIALISYGSINRLIDGANWVDRTHPLMLRLEEFMSQLEQTESRQRGYLISGDEQHLAPYRAAVQALPAQIQMLHEMTADNPQQQKSLVALGPLVSSRSALLEPVVVLTSSAEDRDVIESYQLGVNSYIVKPLEFDKLVQEVSTLSRYWLIMNRVPPTTN